MLAQHLPRISLDEFLELEATAERKSEYLEGRCLRWPRRLMSRR